MGPDFNNVLAVDHTMNDKNNGRCLVKDSEWDLAKYCVETDTEGNSVLTGENKYFTCTGLEVFLIE
jgi:hypothetical protein